MANLPVAANGENESKAYNQNVRHKEKRRTESINKAFSELRKCIPNVPGDTKLSKIKTLHLASSYIAYLSEILENAVENDQQNGKEFNVNFKAQLSSRTQKANTNFSYKDRKMKCVRDISNSDKKECSGLKQQSRLGGKRVKGRTGWPETVWAEALENKTSRSDNSLHLSTINATMMVTPPLSIDTVDYSTQPYQMNASSLRYCAASFYGEVEVLLNSHDSYQTTSPTDHRQLSYQTPATLIPNDNDFNYTESLFSENEDFNPSSSDSYSQYKADLDCKTTSMSEMTNLSFTQDSVHTSVVPFPMVPPFDSPSVVHSLPSISTLCYPDKSRISYNQYDVSCGMSEANGYGPTSFLQNDPSNEPNFVELQPVTGSRNGFSTFLLRSES